MPLTDKKRKFCELYSLEQNATKAAIGAGYSPTTAKQQGSRLLTDVDVQEYLQKLQAAATTLAAERTNGTIASLAEVLEWYTGVMKRAKPDDDEGIVRNGLKAAKGLQEHYEGKKELPGAVITIDKLLVMIGNAQPGKLGETAKGLLTVG